jgi:AcrR family transcriptional regulator
MSKMTTFQKNEESILEAAIVVFKNNHAASVEEIIVQAKVSRATFYKFFTSKQALVVEVALYSMHHMDELLIEYFIDPNNTAAQKLMYMFEKIIPLSDRYTFLINFPAVDVDKKVVRYAKQQRQELSGTIREAQIDGVLRDDLPMTWILELIDMLIYAGWKTLATGEVSLNETIRLSQAAFQKSTYV